MTAQRLPNRRLMILHLTSRRTVPALAIVAICAAALRMVPHIHWLSSKGLQAQLVPLIFEAGAGMAIAASVRSPFGEPERTAGPLLPVLRLTISILSTAGAVGLLLLGATGTTLAGGDLTVVRNLAGLVGIGLLSAATLGGSFAWVGPAAYLVVAEQAIDGAWSTPWAWPARPPHDHGAALCAALVFLVAMAVVTLFGARDSQPDQAAGALCGDPCRLSRGARTTVAAAEHVNRRGDEDGSHDAAGAGQRRERRPRSGF